MEEAKNGVIDLTDRILKELLRKPWFKDNIRTILQNIDPESSRSLVRTFMWKDPELFLALLGAIPAVANAFIKGIDELLIQLKEKFSPELLHDFVKSIVLEIDRKTIENIIQNGKGLTMQLWQVAEEALREKDRAVTNPVEEK
jgi:hypothetical protein